MNHIICILKNDFLSSTNIHRKERIDWKKQGWSKHDWMTDFCWKSLLKLVTMDRLFEKGFFVRKSFSTREAIMIWWMMFRWIEFQKIDLFRSIMFRNCVLTFEKKISINWLISFNCVPNEMSEFLMFLCKRKCTEVEIADGESLRFLANFWEGIIDSVVPLLLFKAYLTLQLQF